MKKLSQALVLHRRKIYFCLKVPKCESCIIYSFHNFSNTFPNLWATKKSPIIQLKRL